MVPIHPLDKIYVSRYSEITMKSDLLTAAVGILAIVTILGYAGFLLSAKMHFEAAAQRDEALKQLDTIAFTRELKASHKQ